MTAKTRNDGRFVKIKSSDIFNPLPRGNSQEKSIGVYVGEESIIFFNLPEIEALDNVYGDGSQTIFDAYGTHCLSSNFGEEIYCFAQDRFGDSAVGKQVYTYVINESARGQAFARFVLRTHKCRAPDVVFIPGYSLDQINSAGGLKIDLDEVNSFLCVDVDFSGSNGPQLFNHESIRFGCISGLVTRNTISLAARIKNTTVVISDIDTLHRLADDASYKRIPLGDDRETFCLDLAGNGLSMRVFIDDDDRKRMLVSAKEAQNFCRDKQKDLSIFNTKNVAALVNLRVFLESDSAKGGRSSDSGVPPQPSHQEDPDAQSKKTETSDRGSRHLGPKDLTDKILDATVKDLVSRGIGGIAAISRFIILAVMANWF